MNHTLRRGLCLLVTTGTLLLGAAGTVAAAPASSAPLSASATAPRTAACPPSATRVKTTTSPAIYLIGPHATAYWIPSPQDYLTLFSTWSGIYTISDDLMWSCFDGYWTMTDPHLAKKANESKVYIYDSSHGGYRWITSPDIFIKYGFAWDKIRIQSVIWPISSEPWDE